MDIPVKMLMTRDVQCADIDDTITSVSADMKFGRFRHVPVLDKDSRLVGIVSDRDLIWAFCKNGEQIPLPVSRVMSRVPHTVTPETPVSEAVDTLRRERISALPVVDDDGKLVGILTEVDFARHVYAQLTGHTYIPDWNYTPEPRPMGGSRT